MTTNKINHILVDMDGVLVDFVGGSFRALGRSVPFDEIRWDYYSQLGMTEDDFWHAIHAIGSDFWSNLDPLPWCRDLIRIVGEICPTWEIASTPSKHPSAQSGKAEWLDHYLGNGQSFEDYNLTRRKWRLAKPGVVLIDDNDKNCRQFCDHGGESVLFPQPWNANRDLLGDGFDRAEFVRQQLAMIGESLACGA